MTEMKAKPRLSNSQSQAELDKVEDQFEAHEENLKNLNEQRCKAPKEEVEPQTLLSKKEIEKSKEIYLKPERTISCRDKFNERWREDYNFSKEYVYFIAENREIIGETIEIWTRPFPGMPSEFWKVPVNKPVWGPRYLAEQIKRCCYHRFVMQQHVITENNTVGQMYGAMAVDTTVHRLDALPISKRKSVFTGASGF